MLGNISWTDYIAIIIILLVLYYIFIGIRYYSNELRQLLLADRKALISAPEFNMERNEELSSKFKTNQVELFDFDNSSVNLSNEKKDIFSQVEQFTIQLKERIAEAANKKYIKEEFILSLQSLTKKYDFLKGSSFFTALNNLIASECEKYDYIHLTEDDRLRLWNE